MNWLVGCDFTSAPSKRKPLVNAWLRQEGRRVELVEVMELTKYDDWIADFQRRPAWVAALDFPFSLPYVFLDAIGWSRDWTEVQKKIAAMTKPEFLALVKAFADSQPYGSKEPSRKTERAVGSFSAIKLGRPSMARMAYEGISRLTQIGDRVFPYEGEGDRVVVEAYAGVVARQIIGRRSYKGKATDHACARVEIWRGLNAVFNVDLVVPGDFEQTVLFDAEADILDAVIAGLQAYWASDWVQHIPNLEGVEGFIAHENSRHLLSV